MSAKSVRRRRRKERERQARRADEREREDVIRALSGSFITAIEMRAPRPLETRGRRIVRVGPGMWP